MAANNISFVPSSKVTVTPLSEAVFQALALGREGAQLAWPAGSFLITDSSPQPITAIVVVWQYVDDSGHQKVTRLTLDGYLVASEPMIVPAGGSSFVTPRGSVRLEHVARLARGDSFVGDLPTLSAQEMSDETAHPSQSITVVIDAVILANGEIVGPNKTRYETVIQDRYQAAQSVLTGIASARERGLEDAEYLSQVVAETDINTNMFTLWKVRFSKRLLNSPNRQGTLDDMKMMSIPTHFFNDAGVAGDAKGTG